jgi:hypothetical protein
MPRDPKDNADQPPEVDIHDSRKQNPPAAAAAQRVIEFVRWYGDGEVHIDGLLGAPPLYARDLEALARAVLGPSA